MRNLIIGLLLGLLLSGTLAWAGNAFERFNERWGSPPSPTMERNIQSPRIMQPSVDSRYDRYLNDAYEFGPLPEWENGRGPWSSQSKTPC